MNLSKPKYDPVATVQKMYLAECNKKYQLQGALADLIRRVKHGLVNENDLKKCEEVLNNSYLPTQESK